jgi:hypothetical protein
MSKLAQLGPILKESLPGPANKLGVNIYQVMGGLILGAAAMTMISGGRIQIDSLTGPYIFTPASAAEEPVRSAHAMPRERLTPGVAAVCEASPLMGKTIIIFTPKRDDGIKVSAVKYVPCSKEELSKEIILLHPDDMQKIAKDLLTDGPFPVIDRLPGEPLFS